MFIQVLDGGVGVGKSKRVKNNNTLPYKAEAGSDCSGCPGGKGQVNSGFSYIPVSLFGKDGDVAYPH